MTADPELAGIEAAYEAIKGLDRRQWDRAIRYLAERLAEDDRTGFITQNPAASFPPPISYIERGIPDCFYDSREGVLDESSAATLEVIEVNGIATVTQEFAVFLPTDEDGSGSEAQWFPTRAAAEAFIASLDSNLDEGTADAPSAS